MEEAYRILDAGGSLVLTTPTRLAKPMLGFMAYRLHIIDEEGIREHKHYYTKTELFDLFKKSGFENYQHKKFFFGLNSFAIAKKIK